MNPFSEEDQPLSSFLRQNKPDVPPASPELEERLLGEISEMSPQAGESLQRPKRSEKRPILWLVPSAIAAGLVATLVNYRAFSPLPSNPAETADLEAFIENTWSDPVADPASDPVNNDLFVPAKDTTVN